MISNSGTLRNMNLEKKWLCTFHKLHFKWCYFFLPWKSMRVTFLYARKARVSLFQYLVNIQQKFEDIDSSHFPFTEWLQFWLVYSICIYWWCVKILLYHMIPFAKRQCFTLKSDFRYCLLSFSDLSQHFAASFDRPISSNRCIRVLKSSSQVLEGTSLLSRSRRRGYVTLWQLRRA